MSLKWNKKICIGKITESPLLPSPFEEQQSNGNKLNLAQLGQMLKQRLTGNR